MNMHSFVDARQSVGYLESTGANLSQSLKRLSTGIKLRVQAMQEDSPFPPNWTLPLAVLSPWVQTSKMGSRFWKHKTQHRID